MDSNSITHLKNNGLWNGIPLLINKIMGNANDSELKNNALNNTDCDNKLSISRIERFDIVMLIVLCPFVYFLTDWSG